jgi:hypothetical protein
MNFFVVLGDGVINRLNGGYFKRGAELGSEWAGLVGPGRPSQTRFGPVRPRFPPRLLLVQFLICVHLHVSL